jgi:adenylylsulfate kinase-like enzyme
VFEGGKIQNLTGEDSPSNSPNNDNYLV